MNVDIAIQNVCNNANIPTKTELTRWIKAAIIDEIMQRELCLRIVDVAEMTSLNEQYRNKPGPTNVLSFPADLPADLPDELSDEKNYLGDLVVCAEVLEREANEQKKSIQAHWAHLIVHGTLHLQGYDHIKETEAIAMEGLEVDILKGLGFADPYQTTEESR